MSETVYLDIIYNLAGDITNIRNRIPGFTGSCSKYTPVLKTNSNIISILKQFRVQRDEFSTLSDILSSISSTSNEIQRTFQLTDRQGTFTNKYLITGLGSLIQITNPITINISPGCLTFTINIIPQTKLSYIRHELINPLHTIKLSSSLMKDQPSNINKLGDLIASKVDESLNVLDGLLAIGNSPRLDPIDTHSFITYINDYIISINQSYLQSIKPNIIWPQSTNNLNYYTQSTGTLYVNTCYIKVILDNIFKNIFGHLDNRVSDREFHDFTVKIDSPDTIGSPPYMHIIIRNRILDSMARPNKSIPFVYSKLSSTSKLQDIYHLDTSNYAIPPATLNQKPKTQVSGTGLKLIDELCKKMNIQWQIEASDDDTMSRDPSISFTLKIPISHSLNRKNKHVFAPVLNEISV